MTVRGTFKWVGEVALFIVVFFGIIIVYEIVRMKIFPEVPALTKITGRECEDHCTIAYNNGGKLGDFLAALNQVILLDTQLIIAGPCYSSCVFLADYARPNVCIMALAKFNMHKGRNPRTGARSIVPARKDIKEWVEANGGWPEDGFLTMHFKEALQFWPRCSDELLKKGMKDLEVIMKAEYQHLRQAESKKNRKRLKTLK